MLLLSSLAPFVILANAVAANPIVVRDSILSLPLSRYMNATSPGALVTRDRERARSFMNRNSASTSEIATTGSVGVTNVADSYTINVGVGIPPTYYNLILDTGSSNTWVGAKKKYVKTKTSVKSSNSVSQMYGSGSFSGTEYTDTLTIGPGLVVSKQSIGVASSSTGFVGVDGIFGIGPADLTIGSLFPAILTSIPTVTDNLFTSGVVKSDVFSVSFEPTNKRFDENGELTFGGTDNTKFTGDITYAPITTANPANMFWAVDLSIRYGSSGGTLQKSPCVIDTGTTLILLETDTFHRYRDATGAVLDKKTQLLRITPAQFANLKPLTFTIANRDFEFPANAQIWPRTLNWLIGGESDYLYLVISDIGAIAAQDIACICGYTFLERYYTVFDATNHRVGFATTPFTMADSN